MRLCGAAFGILRTYDGQRFNAAAARGVPPRFAEFLSSNPQDPQHGGAIAVESEVGHFTEFTVRLPRVARPSPRGAGP
jgi:hypothetical protein